MHEKPQPAVGSAELAFGMPSLGMRILDARRSGDRSRRHLGGRQDRGRPVGWHLPVYPGGACGQLPCGSDRACREALTSTLALALIDLNDHLQVVIE